MFRRTIIVLDILAIITIGLAPALLVPSYFFSEEVSTVAIIGGGDSPFVIMTADKSKWGNFLFPLLILLIVCNFYYLLAFFKKRINKS